METHLSKHLQTIVAKEEDRIRREIMRATVQAFIACKFTVSISHDSANETERRYNDSQSATRYALSSVTAQDGTGTVWLFAYLGKTKAPAHWVRFQTGNVQDIISDYSTGNGTNEILAPVEKIAEKYD